jgi:hypothetical protein
VGTFKPFVNAARAGNFFYVAQDTVCSDTQNVFFRPNGIPVVIAQNARGSQMLHVAVVVVGNAATMTGLRERRRVKTDG